MTNRTLDAQLDVEQLLEKLCRDTQALIEERKIEAPYLIGIRSGGVWLAERLATFLKVDEPVGVLDISFYRDDFTKLGLNPKVGASLLPQPTEDRDILLVDDVLMTGRTIRAAMNELFDFGRPNSVSLLTLLDVNGRELPIQADVIGGELTLKAGEQVKLNGPEPLSLTLGQRG
jgi:pyrimidine operon attenuation protein/uracil phosphoribosyltransferase